MALKKFRRALKISEQSRARRLTSPPFIWRTRRSFMAPIYNNAQSAKKIPARKTRQNSSAPKTFFANNDRCAPTELPIKANQDGADNKRAAAGISNPYAAGFGTPNPEAPIFRNIASRRAKYCVGGKYRAPPKTGVPLPESAGQMTRRRAFFLKKARFKHKQFAHKQRRHKRLFTKDVQFAKDAPDGG